MDPEKHSRSVCTVIIRATEYPEFLPFEAALVRHEKCARSHYSSAPSKSEEQWSKEDRLGGGDVQTAPEYSKLHRPFLSVADSGALQRLFTLCVVSSFGERDV